MKKRINVKSTVASVGIALAFTIVVVLSLKPHYQSSSADTAPESPVTNADGTVQTTRSRISDLYLATDPSEWFSEGDDVNWNDQLVFRVESVNVSKTLPDDVEEMTEWYIRGFEHYQKTVDSDENKMFIDIILQVTCIGLPSGSAYGLSLEDSYCTVTAGQAQITYYDVVTGQLTESIGHEVAVQDLSDNADTSVGVDYYQLSVGQTARFRVLHIISKEMWENSVVLLTPQCGRYNTDLLNRMNYDQPHIHLNEHHGVRKDPAI